MHNASYRLNRIDELVEAGHISIVGPGSLRGTTRYQWDMSGRTYLFDVDARGRTRRVAGVWASVADNTRQPSRQARFLEGADGKKWNASHLFAREAGGPWDVPNFVKGNANWNQIGEWRKLEKFLNKNAVGEKIVMNIHYRGIRIVVPSNIVVSGPGFRKIVEHE